MSAESNKLPPTSSVPQRRDLLLPAEGRCGHEARCGFTPGLNFCLPLGPRSTGGRLRVTMRRTQVEQIWSALPQ